MVDKRFTWMHSGQTGAPQMDGAKLSEGQMLKVLDAALVNGFNSKTVLSATTDNESVTLTFELEHNFEMKQLVEVSGATDSLLNGRHRVLSRTLNSVTLDAAGVTDVTGGTITAKVAPLGFESIFGDSDNVKRAYRSSNPETTQTVLFLDGTIPTGAGYNTSNPAKRYMVSLCQDMTTLGTEINSYTSAFNKRPTVKNGSMLWYQSRPDTKTTAGASSSLRSWVVVGNSDVFYLFNEWQDYHEVGTAGRDFYAFGDANSLGGDSDIYNCFWIGSMQPNDEDGAHTATTGATIGGDVDSAPIGLFIKSHTGIGSIEPFVFTTNGRPDIMYSGAVTGSTVIPLPNPVSQSLVCFPIMALTGKGLRANFPNLYAIPQNMQDNAASYDLVFNGNILTVAVAESRFSSGILKGFYAINIED